MAVEIRRDFVSLESPTAGRNGAGYLPCQGLFWQPSRTAPSVAFIASHYNVDFSEHYLGSLMAERGFGFLGWNTRFRGNEAFFLLEHALIDIGVGVQWLREQGIETVVLVGNSGGGSLMAAYQSQTLGVTMQPTPGLKLPPAMADLCPGDFYVSLNAHGGRPEVLTNWMDPSVTDETDPVSLDPTLDMYNPENGPPYSSEFVTCYRSAQRERNDRITQWVHAELERIAAHGASDRAFNLYRTWADLRMCDGSLDPSSRPLGRCYAGDPRRANYGPRGIGLTNTLRTWLSMWSLTDSHCRGAPHLTQINVPALVVQSDEDTGVFPSDARAIYDALGSSDKMARTLAGDHYLTAPEGAREQVADVIQDWLRART